MTPRAIAHYTIILLPENTKYSHVLYSMLVVARQLLPDWTVDTTWWPAAVGAVQPKDADSISAMMAVRVPLFIYLFFRQKNEDGCVPRFLHMLKGPMCPELVRGTVQLWRCSFAGDTSPLPLNKNVKVLSLFNVYECQQMWLVTDGCAGLPLPFLTGQMMHRQR